MSSHRFILPSVLRLTFGTGSPFPPLLLLQDMEPFDEALNRNFVTFETKVNESICANTSKRKDAPRKALAYADSAFNNYAQAREVQAGRHAKLAQAMQQKKTIEHGPSLCLPNLGWLLLTGLLGGDLGLGEVPDRAVAAEQYTRALDGLQSLTQVSRSIQEAPQAPG